MGFATILLAFALQTTSSPPLPTPPPVDCNDADHRAFDFWIGDWDVSPTGSTKVIAHSRIEKIVGCAISETYDQTIGPNGKPIDYHGRSISSFVPDDKGWRQFYVDSGGTASTLTGGIVDGAMVFHTKAGPVRNRMTLQANADGSVRQHGEGSVDGKTWIPAYDFTYRRRAATP
jgi:hypothetical protein